MRIAFAFLAIAGDTNALCGDPCRSGFRHADGGAAADAP
jgi:hypothetical protein